VARIMVVDDVREAAVVVQRILIKKGHEVTVFTDEDEALRHAAAEVVDLAIIDAKLRKTEGFEVMAELKKLRPAAQAILLTGFPTAEGECRALALGAAAYCSKPIDKEELEGRVAAALAGGAMIGVN
jgi:DNA-binding response OmpR family regulator